MSNADCTPVIELIYVIANYGMGSKILRKAKEYGIPGGTIFHGRGTVNNSLLNFLSLYDQRKEVVMFGTDGNTADIVLDELNKVFQFEKPNHGIVFTTDVCEIVGSRFYRHEKDEEGRGVDQAMYKVIFTIVNRGRAEDAIDAAKEAGSKGGTIINARGSGIHETTKVFNMEIEPEKEIVLILAKEDIAGDIVDSIRRRLEIDKPGNGIVFVQNVNRTYGIYE